MLEICSIPVRTFEISFEVLTQLCVTPICTEVMELLDKITIVCHHKEDVSLHVIAVITTLDVRKQFAANDVLFEVFYCSEEASQFV